MNTQTAVPARTGGLEMPDTAQLAPAPEVLDGTIRRLTPANRERRGRRTTRGRVRQGIARISFGF